MALVLGASLIGGGQQTKSETTKSQLTELLEQTAKNKRKENKENKEKKQIFSVDFTKDLEKSPFGKNNRIVPDKMGELLWYKQTDFISKQFNQKAPIFSAENSYLSLKIEHLKIPVIYPDLESYFPCSLDQLWTYPLFQSYKNKITTQNLVVISRCDNGKAALAYYKNWKLTLATYVSLGTKSSNPKENHATVEGVYPLKHDMIFRRSRKYKTAAMPYALHFYGGYFVHQGKSDGGDRSHGCVRVPGLYQRKLYQELPKDAQILLKGLYTPTLTKLQSNKKR